ncbi:MAG: alpha/beta hydrolase [Methylotenera sp.]|nr:alpha/beta hydrolase [Oligoflexia bacterium]
MNFHVNPHVCRALTAAAVSTLFSLSVFAADQTAPAQAVQAKPNEQMQQVLTELGSMGGKPMDKLSAKVARQQPTPAQAVEGVLKKENKSTAPQPVAKVEDRTIQAANGQSIPVRIYWPEGKGPFPVTVYFHGGGWVIADKQVYDASPRALVNSAKTIVVSADYRKGPEHKFPAAHEDAYQAYLWTLKNAASLNGNPDQVAVAGESAGGNLAMAVSMMARDQGQKLPVYQLIVYPVASPDMNTPSYQENANAKPLNKPMMAWFFKNYLGNASDKKDPRIDLLHANLKGLPSTTLITAQIDPLRSEGEQLAKNLKEAGVKVEYRNYDNVTHEFFGMGAVLDEAKKAEEFAANGLKSAFKG